MTLFTSHPSLLLIMLVLFAFATGCAAPRGAGAQEISALDRDTSMKVIVRLHDDGTTIAERRKRLLTSLEGQAFRLVRQYAALPMLALEVDADARAFLEASPLVDGVSDDRAIAPMPAPTPD